MRPYTIITLQPQIYTDKSINRTLPSAGKNLHSKLDVSVLLRKTDHLPFGQAMELQGTLCCRPDAVERCLLPPPQGASQAFHGFDHMPTKTHNYSCEKRDNNNTFI